MRYSKKGDLAISTNAIVVLIIAVIMLGLIIGFITNVFGGIEKNFRPQVERLPPPPTPNAQTQITTSELVISNAGKPFGMKVSIYNKDTGPADDVKPSISCSDTSLITTQEANPNTIEGKSFETYILLGTISDAATPGRYLCQLTATVGPDTAQSDLIMEVAQ